MKERIMLIYPPGDLFIRGEDRCQANVEVTTATSMRACNDLGYCAAVLLNKGYRVYLKDYQTENLEFHHVKQDIDAFSPDMIFISTTTGSILNDLVFIKKIKKYRECSVVLKGAIFYDASDQVFQSLDLDDVDYLIGCEAEACIGQIADWALRKKGNIDEVYNIFYKDKKKKEFIKTEFGLWKEDIEELPFPTRELMNNDLYVRPDTGEAMATIQISRGCPFSCIYCLSPIISGRKIRQRSTKNVMQEIEECYYKHKIKNFFLKADNFTMNEEWVEELCNLILSSSLKGKIQFTANSRVHPLTLRTLQLMKLAGCFAIAFGFESGSEHTLKLIKKGTNRSQNMRAAKWAKNAGLLVYGFFMIGFPWETKYHLEDTKRHIFDIQPDFLEIFIAQPQYGTDLYLQCIKKKTLSHQGNVLGSDFYNACITGTQSLSLNYLISFRNKTIWKYYFRPTYIGARLRDCINNPKILLNYIRYGCKLLKLSLKF